ncbi:MAG: sigma-70 family RNA polymerase sigma factor [Anaerolineales bacterium]|nr:sigma-70 family RNA polymerase sigma factor [Anaerolineales bacterium]MCW5855942.1 sigma-70 family RNA polymerase sigma factor [Anaerolineales bacterium]MCW5877647.1 sigma-70 family RNA polymerase sigma factor [Anaerolineales bacterium]
MQETPQIQEDQLVREAMNGGEQAFAALYDEYIDSIYRFIFLRVEDQQTAEDIAANVFMRAWEKLGSYQFRGVPFRAWLFRIARNAVVDHYRTRKETAPLEAVVNTHDESAIPVSQQVGLRIEVQQVMDCMQELTRDQRNVLTLKLVHGLSTKEIAKSLGKRQGAVRALQMRGLQALAKLLEKNGN